MSDKHLVTKPAAVFSGFTILSRILGLARDIFAAAIFGAGMFWDSLVVAFTIPNLFRRIFGEGALSSSFVPIFSEYLHKKGKDEGWRIANVITSLLTITLVVLTIVIVGGIILIRGIVPLGEKADLILKLLQIVFPYVIFICLVGLFMGILNTFHKLAVPAVAPAVFNLVLIIGIAAVSFFYKQDPQTQIILVSWIILLGGFTELIIHVPILKSVGMHYKFIPDWHNPAVKRIFFLMGPMILGLGITQINIVVDRLLALFIGNGAVSKLYFGNRLMQLPLGIFGVALAISSLSVMSKQAARDDLDALKDTLNYSMRLVFFIGLPAAVGLIILRIPIIKVIFQHGEFTSLATQGCARVLLCYSLGLFAYLGLKVVTKCFYALQDTKTPVKIAACMAVLNLVLNLILMIPFKEAGLALATAICAVLNMSILVNLLSRKIHKLNFYTVIQAAWRNVLAAVVMGACCFILWSKAPIRSAVFVQALYLCMTILIGIIVYIGSSILLGAKEPKEIINNLKLKINNNEQPS